MLLGSGELLRQKPVGADGAGPLDEPEGLACAVHLFLEGLRAPRPSLPAPDHFPFPSASPAILTHQGPVRIPLSGESGPVVSAAGPTGWRLHWSTSPRLE